MNAKLVYFLSCILLYNLIHAAPPEHMLVNLRTLIPTVVVELLYATPNNFTHKQLYPCSKCYLVKEAAEALKKVQEDLSSQGLGLKIWDAYRPWSVQKILWDACPDENYVMRPDKISRHNRGAAVDLTIVHLENNQELDMGTGFDNFTEKAWRNCRDISELAQANRMILENAMKKHGFIGLLTEWWHYDLEGYQQFPALDVPFEELS